MLLDSIRCLILGLVGVYFGDFIFYVGRWDLRDILVFSLSFLFNFFYVCRYLFVYVVVIVGFRNWDLIVEYFFFYFFCKKNGNEVFWVFFLNYFVDILL